MAPWWRRFQSGRQMSPAVQRTFALALALVALAVALVPVLQPLAGGDLTCGYDDAFHLYRAVQIARLWDDGILFSRWAPDMALGLGFPLFVFASPFPPSLVALVHRLGAAWPVALNMVFALGLLIGCAGMFWLTATLVGPSRSEAGRSEAARSEAGRRSRAMGAGLVAAVAYAYAPFQAYDVFNRGSLWEAFAWAFPPLVLLGLHRWSVNRDRRFLLLGVGAFAAMVLSHHLFAFLFAPVFGLWVIASALSRRSWAVLLRGAMLGILGLGITAFFWLPAVAERSLVQTGRLLGTWVFDYRYNFLSVGDMLALPRRADPSLLNDWPEKALGLVPVLLALLSLSAWRRLSRPARWQVGALWVTALGSAFLTLSASGAIWNAIPLLSFVQFPWRYLGPAAFCVALLTGMGAGALMEGRGEKIRSWRAGATAGLPAVLLAGLMLANLGWFYPDRCAAPGQLTVAGMIRWERLTDTLGTTAKGEYLPIWVQQFPDVSLDAQYSAEGPVARLSPADLPEGARIVDARYGAQSAELGIETPVAFRARYLAFYYPGWHVRVDGAPVAAAPEAGSGLLTFEVPAGEHTVEVRFGETPIRWGGDGLSVLSVGALVVLLGRPLGFGSQRSAYPASKPQRSGPEAAGASPWVSSVFALAAVVAVFAVKAGVVDRLGVAWRATRLDPDGTLTGAVSPANVDFGNRAMLLGMEPLPEAVQADASPVLTLYWRALDPGTVDWQVGLTLIAPDGSRWPAGLRPARWARTPPPLSEWASDAYARMDYDVDLPAGLAPGRFTLALALFDRATALPASVIGPDGNPVGPELAIGEIEVRPPSVVPGAAELGAVGDVDGVTCGPLTLMGADVRPRQVAPGDLLTVATAWEATAVPGEDLTPHVCVDGCRGCHAAPVGGSGTGRLVADEPLDGGRPVGRPDGAAAARVARFGGHDAVDDAG